MIRHARTADHPAIEAVLQAAFGRGDEGRLVSRLRADGDVAFELVAEEAGEVVGHILFSRLWADRRELYAGLAPLAVLPGRQKSGLGSALVRASLETAREFGCHGILVLGDPAYYGRFGFSAGAAAGVGAPYRGLAGFQALALEDHAFAGEMSVSYPDAFSDAPSEPL
ncbi:GNAT family N-acetyltransferase [Phenylobacterium sp.]|uniref:GNAT family N-acetyltransferase n=1 Tax=Phenylobacterium sp. TaxID=1871053 RepID=UPI0035694052